VKRSTTPATVIGLLVALAGGVTLAGWAYAPDLLVRVSPRQVTTTPNSAVGFVLAGLALCLRARRGVLDPLGRLLALGVVALGAATVAEHAATLDLGIDHWLLPAGSGPTEGRMALAAGVVFLCLGLALLTLHARPVLGQSTAHLLAMAGGFGGEITLLGYAFEAPALRHGPFAPLAVPTAVAFWVFAIGVYAVRSDIGFVGNVTAPTNAGWLLRRLLFVGVVMPPALGGFLVTWIDSGSIEFGEAMLVFTIAMSTLVCGVAYFGAVRVGKAEEALEERKRLADDRLEAAFHGSGAGMVLFDGAGDLVKANAAFERLVRRSEDELRRLDLMQIIHPDDRAPSEELLGLVRDGVIDDYHVEARMLVPDSQPVWVSISIAVVRAQSRTRDVEHLIANVFDISDRKTMEMRLETLALTDPLTGLANRNLFFDRLNQALLRAPREVGAPALLYVDLDHFKTINDRFGHDVGDQVLHTVATRLTSAVRAGDTVGRIGGDEFVVLCELVSNEDEARALAARVNEMIELPLTLDHGGVVPSASVGVALARPDSTPASLIDDADQAMYVAKRSGRACYAVAPG
jgi:diguanylate cyclase (GGDEF)-like protein/PAS domain S-box-containing protein